MPVSTPSLVTRAALVATGTTAVALLTLLPAGAARPPLDGGGRAGRAGRAPRPRSRRRATPSAQRPPPPVAPAVQAPVKLVAAAKPRRTGRGRGGRGGAAARWRSRMGKLGAPYRWGAAGPGAFDCSGLVYWSYRQTGLTLPRTSWAQSQVGTPVSKGALQPGDLVFFYRPVSHVAIYIGDGRVVHASTAGKPVKISNLNDMPFATARRI